MVKPSQVADGIITFAESEMLPALDGWQLWAASAALILASQRAELIVNVLLENKIVSALGLVGKDGMIDIDAAAEAMKETAKKRGKLEIDLPAFGKVKFSESDFDKLLGYINDSQA